MARRVAEAGRQVAERHPGAAGGHVVGDPQRAVAAGDDGRLVAVDPLAEPGGQLVDVAGGRDVQVGVERMTGELDRASDGIGPCAAGPLVEEDGSARGHYGSAARISATCSSDPVRKYSVSSFV